MITMNFHCNIKLYGTARNIELTRDGTLAVVPRMGEEIVICKTGYSADVKAILHKINSDCITALLHTIGSDEDEFDDIIEAMKNDNWK